MRRVWLFLTGLAFAFLLPAGSLRAADPDRCTPTPSRGHALEDQALAARIDQLIEAAWKKDVKPAPLADDAEFLRRAYLDLAGRIPAYREAESFLADKSPDKRRHLVEKLLDGPGYIYHFSNVWRALLLPQANSPQVQPYVGEFEAWLGKVLMRDVPYNEMVRELLTSQTGFRRRGSQRYDQDNPSPIAFYQANELKPENLAASTSRLFLGVKLECAQCHDHPRASWTRQQFWEYAAFFSGVSPKGAMLQSPGRRVVQIPGTDRLVEARFLDGSEPRWQADSQARVALADWITRPSNPYFARAAVNRLWSHFFGVGLVEPVDDMSDENRPSHPELLDELANQFIARGYDLKYLIRAITLTRAYQRASALSDPSQKDPHVYARMAARGLTPEQLFDSLIEATGLKEPKVGGMAPPGMPPNTLRSQFLAKFSGQERPIDAQTSILQALSLMNGTLTGEITNPQNSINLSAVLLSPGCSSPTERIEALFLLTLSRKPRPEEAARLAKYVAGGGPAHEPNQALADVFWALLNSGEFMTNH
jgi:Protein of unknown function (DUF1553)/Protein of unknown function (DUF1549)